jgi:hypothetical protein
MMFYDMIYEGSHSRGISMHMLPAKAMGSVYITPSATKMSLKVL